MKIKIKKHYIFGLILLVCIVLASASPVDKIQIHEGDSKLNILKYTGIEAQDFLKPTLENGEICFEAKEKNKYSNVEIYKEKNKSEKLIVEKKDEDKDKNKFCVVSDFAQLGENTIVAVNQAEKSVVFSVDEINNVTATLYKGFEENGSYNWDNTVDEIGVGFNNDRWKYYADDNYTDGNTNRYKYHLSSTAPLTKEGGRYYFRTGANQGYLADFSDICGWFNNETNETANCVFSDYKTEVYENVTIDGVPFVITSYISNIEVEFSSNGSIDPYYSYEVLNVDSLLVNTTSEGDSIHLDVSDSVPYDSLVAYYPFDSDDNSTAYDYTGSHDGTYIDNTTTNLGVYGNVGVFDGSGDYISMGDKSDFENIDTLSGFAWVKVAENDGDPNVPMGVISKGNYYNADSSWSFAIRSPLTSMVFSIGNQAYVVGSYTFTPGEWYHVGFIYNNESSLVRLYVNGVNISYGFTSGSFVTIPDTEQVLSIGYSNSYFNGSIDEVMIFNTSLTTQQIQDIYNNQSQRFKKSGSIETKAFEIEAGNNTMNVSVDYFAEGDSSLNISLGEWDVSKGYNETMDGLVAYYHADGNANDSVGSNNGVLNGNTTASGDGVYNFSFEFDRTTDTNIDLGSEIIGDGADSVCAWIYPYDWGSTDYGRIMDNGKFDLFLVGASSLNKLRFMSDGATALSTSDNTISLNEWQFVCVERNSTGYANLYINAVLGASGNSGTPASGDSNLTIGSQNDSTRQFNGSIDEVMIFNRSLSIDEIKELYIKGRANFEYTTPEAVSEFNEISISSTTTNILSKIYFVGNFSSPIIDGNVSYLSLDSQQVSIYFSIPDNYEFGKRQEQDYITQSISYVITGSPLNTSYYRITFPNGSIIENSSAGASGLIQINMSDYGGYNIFVNSSDIYGKTNNSTIDFKLTLVSGAPQTILSPSNNNIPVSISEIIAENIETKSKDIQFIKDIAQEVVSLFSELFRQYSIIFIFFALIFFIAVFGRSKK